MGRQKLTIKDINIRLADRGIQIVGEYVNQRTKTVFKCQRAHVWEATPHSILHMRRGCPHCSNNTISLDEVSNRISNIGYTLLSSYTNAKTKLHLRCNNRHDCFITLDGLTQGKRCPYCSLKWENGGFLYIMSSSSGTKVGISLYPEKRLNEVKRESGFSDLYLFTMYHLPDRETALDLEKEVHREYYNKNCGFSSFTGSTEFFNVAPEDIVIFLSSFGLEDYGH
ncbi:GIY-YIG nuclease family protein [Escherichia coli]